MKNKNEFTPLFDESDYEELRKLGLTDEEYETLQNAEAIRGTVEMLPEGKEFDKFLAKFKKLFANKNIGKELEEFFGLAETDPEYFLQICAFFEVLDMNVELPEQKAGVEKVSLDTIKQENETQQKEELKDAFMEFAKIFAQLTPEEKEELKRTSK